MFTIEFETDNAAFEDAAAEIARILRNVAAQVEVGRARGLAVDENGNSVGQFWVEVES